MEEPIKPISNLVDRISRRVYLDSPEEIENWIKEYVKSELSSKEQEIELITKKFKVERDDTVNRLNKHVEELTSERDELKAEQTEYLAYNRLMSLNVQSLIKAQEQIASERNEAIGLLKMCRRWAVFLGYSKEEIDAKQSIDDFLSKNAIP